MSAAPNAHKAAATMCVHVDVTHPGGLYDAALRGGQWRAMPDGSDGIHGIAGNVVSVTYRF